MPREDGGPGRRVGHSLTAVDLPNPDGSAPTKGVMLYGGRYVSISSFLSIQLGNISYLDTGRWICPYSDGTEKGMQASLQNSQCLPIPASAYSSLRESSVYPNLYFVSPLHTQAPLKYVGCS